MIKRNKALVSTLLAAICLSTTVSSTVINEKKVYAETNEAAVETEITDNESPVEETIETYGSDNNEVILEAPEGADFNVYGWDTASGNNIKIGDFYFKNCGNCKVEVLKYDGTDSDADIVIPSKIKVKGVLYDVVSIGLRGDNNNNGDGTNTFAKKTFNSITIPDSITAIASYAFKNASISKPLILPKNLEYIGCDAFEGIKGLEEIVIPSTVKTVGTGAFSSCPDLKKVFIEDGVKFGRVANTDSYHNFSTQIFSNCPNLQYVRLPEDSTEIPDSTFFGGYDSKKEEYKYNKIKDIHIPDSVTTIGYNALFGTQIKSIILPYNVEDVEGLKSLHLTDVVIQNTNTSDVFDIYKNNFEYTDTTVWVANEEVKNSLVFNSRYYSSVTNVSYVNNVVVGQPPIAGDWNEDQATVNIYGVQYRRENEEASTVYVSGYSKLAGGLGIPSDINVDGQKYKVTGIADNAFAGNTDLTSAEIWGYTQNIGKNIFDGCSNITTIRLHDGIENISEGAFDGCDASFVVDSEDLKDKVIASGVDESRITLLSEEN